ncbi:hypothetical protein Bpfe_029316, partial [Biomphalaria pfeifferi]
MTSTFVTINSVASTSVASITTGQYSMASTSWPVHHGQYFMKVISVVSTSVTSTSVASISLTSTSVASILVASILVTSTSVASTLVASISVASTSVASISVACTSVVSTLVGRGSVWCITLIGLITLRIGGWRYLARELPVKGWWGVSSIPPPEPPKEIAGQFGAGTVYGEVTPESPLLKLVVYGACGPVA